MNEEKFCGKSAQYDSARPAYASEGVDWLLKQLRLPAQSCIADVGAGTGIFTEQLLRRGLHVIAVEPNTEMRAKAELRCAGLSGFRAVAGSAEQTNLPDRSVDLVTAAQAFHWFDRLRFAAECRRILRPGGSVALLWNSRCMESETVIALERLCRNYCAAFTGFSAGISLQEDIFPELGPMQSASFPMPLSYDCASFLARQCSSSFAPQAGTREYVRYCSVLADFFAQYAVDGVLTIPNETRIYVAQI